MRIKQLFVDRETISVREWKDYFQVKVTGAQHDGSTNEIQWNPELSSRCKHELHQKTQAFRESLWKHQGMWDYLALGCIDAVNSITTQFTDDCWTSVLLGYQIILKESGNTPINWLMSH